MATFNIIASAAFRPVSGSILDRSIASAVAITDVTSGSMASTWFGQSNTAKLSGGANTVWEAYLEAQAPGQDYQLVQEGGTGFRDGGRWNVASQDLSVRLVDTINSQLAKLENGSHVCAPLMWLGENDSFDTDSIAAYEQNIRDLKSLVLAETGLDLPWITPRLNAAAFSYPNRDGLRAVQQSMASGDEFFLIDTDPYTMLPDGRHYPNDQHELIGQDIISLVNSQPLVFQMNFLAPRVTAIAQTPEKFAFDGTTGTMAITYQSNSASPMDAATVEPLEGFSEGITGTATLTPASSNLDGELLTVDYTVTLPAGVIFSDYQNDFVIRTTGNTVADASGVGMRVNAAISKKPLDVAIAVVFEVDADGSSFVVDTTTTDGALTTWKFSDGSPEVVAEDLNIVLSGGPVTVTALMPATTVLVDSRNSRITSVEGIGRLPNANTFVFSDNLLTEIPGSIRDLDLVKKLDVSSNLIPEVPTWIKELQSIQDLRVATMSLTELPYEISELTELQLLFANGNAITELPDLSSARRLKTVRLQACNLTEATLTQLYTTLANTVYLGTSARSVNTLGNPGHDLVDPAVFAAAENNGWVIS